MAAKILHEKSSKLQLILSNMFNAPVQYRHIADIRATIHAQETLVNILSKYRTQVDEIRTQGNELLCQSSVPVHVQQDVDNIDRLYDEKFRSAQEQLNQLQVRIRMKIFIVNIR
jgi:hypothetical protein